MLEKVSIRTTPHYSNKLTDIITLGKDKNKKWDETGVVYKIKSKDYPYVYIGQTKRFLKNRIDEHKKCTNPDS